MTHTAHQEIMDLLDKAAQTAAVDLSTGLGFLSWLQLAAFRYLHFQAGGTGESGSLKPAQLKSAIDKLREHPECDAMLNSLQITPERVRKLLDASRGETGGVVIPFPLNRE